jgi:periplasmic divalent cation tolerance protein
MRSGRILGGQMVVVIVTCPDIESADRIASSLTSKKLAACVNITQEIKSVYRWKGKIEESTELLLIIKTRKELLDRIIQEVKLNHPYQVPEVIALPIVGGSPEYMKWLIQETCQED